MHQRSRLPFTNSKKENHSILLRALSTWREFTSRRKRLRCSFLALNRRILYNLKAHALSILSKHTIENVAAIEIQRLFRGFLGRIELCIQVIRQESATLIQCRWRGCIQRKVFNILSLRRHYAAIEVQRIVRGHLGRQLSKLRLLSVLEEERMTSFRMAKRAQMHSMVHAARVIQPQVKEWLRQTHEETNLKKQRREEAVAQEMDAAHVSYEVEKKVRMKEMEIHQQQMIENAACEERSKRTSLQMGRLRRRLRSDLMERMQRERREVLSRDMEKRKQELVEKWKLEEEQRCQSLKTLISSSLKKSSVGFSAAQRNMHKVSQKDIKKRLSDVLKRAKSRDIKIELDEAREVAREEVIHLRIEEERKRVHSQMNDALKALDVEYDMKLIEIAKKERLTKQVDAATVIYSAVYRWYKEKDVNTSLSRGINDFQIE